MSRMLRGNCRIPTFALLALAVLFLGIACTGAQGPAGGVGPGDTATANQQSSPSTDQSGISVFERATIWGDQPA